MVLDLTEDPASRYNSPMTAPAARGPWTEGNDELGQAYITFTVVNSFDLDRQLLGELADGDVRSISFEDALMDTGATHLCLPPGAVAALGLTYDRSVLVETAQGVGERRIFRNAQVRFEDRKAEVEVIELADGVRPLLGALPMEALGVEPDLVLRKPRKLGTEPGRSHIMVF